MKDVTASVGVTLERKQLEEIDDSEVKVSRWEIKAGQICIWEMRYHLGFIKVLPSCWKQRQEDQICEIKEKLSRANF